MKKGIFVALAALALAIFAVPQAHGSDGQTLQVRLAGSNLITSDQDGVPTPVDGQPLTAIQNGVAKGSGGALFSSQSVLAQAGLDPRCEPPLVGGDLSVTIVLTYNDGSILSVVDTPGETYYCTDGVLFTVALSGTVSGGDGRFEGATGTFTGTASSQGSRVTGDLSIDLD